MPLLTDNSGPQFLKLVLKLLFVCLKPAVYLLLGLLFLKLHNALNIHDGCGDFLLLVLCLLFHALFKLLDFLCGKTEMELYTGFLMFCQVFAQRV